MVLIHNHLSCQVSVIWFQAVFKFKVVASEPRVAGVDDEAGFVGYFDVSKYCAEFCRVKVAYYAAFLHRDVALIFFFVVVFLFCLRFVAVA